MRSFSGALNGRTRLVYVKQWTNNSIPKRELFVVFRRRILKQLPETIIKNIDVCTKQENLVGARFAPASLPAAYCSQREPFATPFLSFFHYIFLSSAIPGFHQMVLCFHGMFVSLFFSDLLLLTRGFVFDERGNSSERYYYYLFRRNSNSFLTVISWEPLFLPMRETNLHV